MADEHAPLSRADHHAQALRWLAIAEAAYDGIYDHGTLPVLAAAGIAQVHAALAGPVADGPDAGKWRQR